MLYAYLVSPTLFFVVVCFVFWGGRGRKVFNHVVTCFALLVCGVVLNLNEKSV